MVPESSKGQTSSSNKNSSLLDGDDGHDSSSDSCFSASASKSPCAKHKKSDIPSPLLSKNLIQALPPPEPLIAKSVFEKEQIRTGAPLSFLQTESFRGVETFEDMNEPNVKGAPGTTPIEEREHCKILADEMIRSF
jgi:hypothetical protein